MEYANCNVNGKIWIISQNNIQVQVLADFEQQLTTKLKFVDDNWEIVITSVYAKCDPNQRMDLWSDLYAIHNNLSLPWHVGGDFNVILDAEEKIGGLPLYPQEYEDFEFCANSCGLIDIKFKGSPFTWWNGRADAKCIFKRLDRLLINHEFLGAVGKAELEHLARTGSDHALLLLSCSGLEEKPNRPFRFLKMWLDTEGFMEVVQNAWHSVANEDVFINLKLKM